MSKNPSRLALLTTLVLAGCMGADDRPGEPAASIYKVMGEHEWQMLDPTNPGGPQIAALWGDPTAGAYGALLRFPAGFASPMHRHSAGEHTVTMQGTALHWTETEPRADAKKMTPGSYTFMPGGVNHVSACAADGPECISFLTQAEKFDFTVAP